MNCPSHLQEVALANLSQDLERELAERTEQLSFANQLWREEDRILQRWKDYALLWKEQRDKAIELADRSLFFIGRYPATEKAITEQLNDLKKEIK